MSKSSLFLRFEGARAIPAGVVEKLVGDAIEFLLDDGLPSVVEFSLLIASFKGLTMLLFAGLVIGAAASFCLVLTFPAYCR